MSELMILPSEYETKYCFEALNKENITNRETLHIHIMLIGH
jgi:hypothetical protein